MVPMYRPCLGQPGDVLGQMAHMGHPGSHGGHPRTSTDTVTWNYTYARVKVEGTSSQEESEYMYIC